MAYPRSPSGWEVEAERMTVDVKVAWPTEQNPISGKQTNTQNKQKPKPNQNKMSK